MAGERAVREMPRPTRPPDAPLTASGPHKTARRLGKKRDVGVRLNCSDDTIDRFERAGKLPIVVRLPSGRKRYDLEALDRLIEEEWKE